MSKLRVIGRKRQLDIYHDLIQKCKDHNCKRWICGDCKIIDPNKCGIIGYQNQQRLKSLAEGNMSMKSFLACIESITAGYKHE